MRLFSIAALQTELYRRDNTDEIFADIQSTKRQFGFVDMICVGELTWFGADIADAVELPGPLERRMCELAGDLNIWLVGGSVFERCGKEIYNTTPVVSPEGDVVLRYRKMYPFLPFEQGVSPGKKVGVFDVPNVGKFGVSICYDMWFPETLRQMTWEGVEVVIHPSLTNTIDRDVENAISRASAAQHQVYFFDVNATGMAGGRSGVYGPGGEILHQAGTGREIIPIEIDLDVVQRVRERGWHGLAQAIKSYRDADVRFPCYEQGPLESRAYNSLGPIHYHNRKTPHPPVAKRGEAEAAE